MVCNDNQARLIGVDTMRLTGQEIAILMNELAVGFLAGALEPPTVTKRPLAVAVQAYEAVAKGGLTAKQILIP